MSQNQPASCACTEHHKMTDCLWERNIKFTCHWMVKPSQYDTCKVVCWKQKSCLTEYRILEDLAVPAQAMAALLMVLRCPPYTLRRPLFTQTRTHSCCTVKCFAWGFLNMAPGHVRIASGPFWYTWGVLGRWRWQRGACPAAEQSHLQREREMRSWMTPLEFGIKFHWNVFLRVQSTISQPW